jgi:EAL domain-containing protein (putative c-di-GMP-specific phosphodiesterase class I)
VIGLAHGIGMTVVAEGVEEPRQQQAITSLGCDMAQGFLLAPPVAADEVACLLEARLSG